jgi:nicotinamidase-related amidase
MMLNVDHAMLLVVDVQGNLAHSMHEKQQLFDNLENLIKGGRILGLPMLLTEQNPRKLGPTLPQFAHLLEDMPCISKLHFSCCGDEAFMQAFAALNRKQVLIAGIEAHVCVYQTTADLLNLGYEVQVVCDAVSSRTAQNRHIGLERMRQQGAILSSTEMALYELMKVAGTPTFREVLKVVK